MKRRTFLGSTALVLLASACGGIDPNERKQGSVPQSRSENEPFTPLQIIEVTTEQDGHTVYGVMLKLFGATKVQQESGGEQAGQISYLQVYKLDGTVAEDEEGRANSGMLVTVLPGISTAPIAYEVEVYDPITAQWVTLEVAWHLYKVRAGDLLRLGYYGSGVVRVSADQGLSPEDRIIIQEEMNWAAAA